MDGLINLAPCGFLIISDAGIITAINETLADWLGYDKDELQGRKLDLIVGVAGQIFYQTHLFPLLMLHNKAEEIFLTLKTKQKNDVPVLLNAKRVHLRGAYENQYVVMPVFQRKKYEDELLKAKNLAEDAVLQNDTLQKAKAALEVSKSEQDMQLTRLLQMHADLANFSKVISHDIREPARKVAVFANVLTREANTSLTTEGKYAISRILKASDHMRSLIACLEQYVSVDMTSETITNCHLTDMVETARQKVLVDMPGEQIELICRQLPVIDGYCDQFIVVFYHLLLNAVQFKKPEADRVVVRIEADIIQQNSYRSIKDKYQYMDYVRIVFSDDGIGFNNDYQDYIFRLFKKAHEHTAGLGFGLALCRKIIESHNGSIIAQSATNSGAKFTLTLPVKSQHLKK